MPQRQAPLDLRHHMQSIAAYMGVDQRRLQIGMSQDLLNGQQIDARFQQFRGEAVAQRVPRHARRESRPIDGPLAGFPHVRKNPS